MPSDVHLWRFNLDAAVDASSLSPDERQRAERLKIPLVRSRFIVGRARLRETLSRYTGLAPADVRFIYTPEGKPFLAMDGTNAASTPDQEGVLHFNLAHSQEHALLAVARFAIGVDIEQIRPMAALQPVADLAFTPEERQRLAAITSEERKKLAFFRLWTCKEAVMKALGGGFKLAHQIEIDLNLSGAAALNIKLKMADLPSDVWSVVQLPAPTGYAAALAVAAAPLTLRFQDKA